MAAAETSSNSFWLEKPDCWGKKDMVIMAQVPYFLLDSHTPNQENVWLYLGRSQISLDFRNDSNGKRMIIVEMPSRLS